MMPWTDVTVDGARSHHRRGDVPLYAERFHEVHEFRAPGLAPVRVNGRAWHIRVDGSEAYSRRFVRTFGFYEGLAAVADEDGWHHVDAMGLDAYARRFSWVGNFQSGRCAVRAADGAHWHIDSRAHAAYDGRWRYAGDFREGLAVVQDERGYSTHIELDGSMAHRCWFRDLDAPHKGYSRARDEDGWFHIDRRGRALYPARFAMVEPYYNGRARVETHEGALAIIDEAGSCTLFLRPPGDAR